MNDAPVLTEAHLHRALLARQRLLERATVSVPRAIEQLGGLQTQYAPSAYIGLWSRLDGFEREHLTTMLERKKVVQGTMMRATIHMVSARDYPFVVEGVRAARRAWWQRATRYAGTENAMQAAARRVRRLLAKGPLRRSELVKLLSADGTVWNGVELWIDLLRVPPSGTWEQRRADLYATAEQWLGPPKVSEAEGIELLVRRYLGAFGPASDKDIANWAGLPTRAIAPATQRLKLRRFRDELGNELLDLRGAPLPDPETRVPARFLPTWDAALLVHARRTQILPERYRPLVFNTKTPHSVTTFLADGRVAGTWRSEGGRVKIQPFERLSRAASREVKDEAERLETFLR
jgi:hypothetical protein